MKAVILDGYAENPGDLCWRKLEEICDVTIYDRTEKFQICERIDDAEIVITNKTPIDENTMKTCTNLKYISVLATGYDIIDIPAAKKYGIYVSNVPSYGTETVSQYAVALLLELCHHVGAHDNAVHEGEWQSSQDWCFWNYPLIELAGKTAGIIGLGRIGRATSRTLSSLGMKIIAFDPVADNSSDENVIFVSLDQIYSQSDVIVLHCPSTKDNFRMINAEAISMMKDGVLIVNNSRGALIDEQALADALNSHKIKGAALDVVSKEPILSDNPLLTAENCIITPHISWATKEARQRILDATVKNIFSYINGCPINTVY